MKKWTLYNLTLIITTLGLVAVFNWFIDPMWTFNQSNFLTIYQNDFDERQQKINRMYFNDFKYDALMLGSSKVTYMNQNHLPQYKAFNAAVNDMRPNEFIPMINFAKKMNKSDFKEIIIGLDFERMMPNPKTQVIASYEKNTLSPLYRYKLLFSIDTFQYSLQNINNITGSDYKRRSKVYTNDFVVSSYKKSPEFIESKIKEYNKPSTLQYNENLGTIFAALKKENPNTKFTVFITPLPSPLIETMFSSKENVKLYKQYIKELVDTFGEIHTFLYLNDVNDNYLNTYTDSGHFYPYVGDYIIKSIHSEVNSPNQFGVYINKDNYQQIMDTIKLSYKEKH